MFSVKAPVSSEKIPSAVDSTLDRQAPSNGEVAPGISLAHGEVKMEDASPPARETHVNGNAINKRKIRESHSRPDYADAESSDDDVPLVCDCLQMTLRGDWTDRPTEQETKNIDSCRV
jgi:hypothetical protein